MAGHAYVSQSTLDDRTTAWLAAIGPWSRRRPLPPLDRAALLVLDVQSYFFDPASHAYLPVLPVILPRIQALIDCFKEINRPVVYTQHGSKAGHQTMMQRWWSDDLRQGEPRAQLIPQLDPQNVDLVLHKHHYSAFRGTTLRKWLGDHGCDTAVICGVMTHLCCESTAREAFMHHIAPVMVADACAAGDEELHLGALRNLAHGFAVVTTSRAILAAARPSNENQGAIESGRKDPLPTKADLVVVGAGPSGIAGAIQATRAGLDVALFEHQRPGGQARTANWIENYPGFPGGIAGDRLMERFVAQLGQLDLPILPNRVDKIEQRTEGLCVQTENAEIKTRAVIIATGTIPKTINGSHPAVAYRADALPYRLRGKRILVIGGGEAALDQALLLHRRGATDVRIAIRGSRPRAMDLLLNRVKEQTISLLTRTTLKNIEVNSHPPRKENRPLLAHLERDGQLLSLPIDAIVTCIGKVPTLPELPMELQRTDGALTNLDALGRCPSIPGLYFAGDVRRGPYRQVSIAVGDGVAAAMHAIQYLKSGIWSP